MPFRKRTRHPYEARRRWVGQRLPPLAKRITTLYDSGLLIYSQDEPPLVETYTLFVPLFATPTKIRGVADPDDPEDLSKVTQAIPILSEL